MNRTSQRRVSVTMSARYRLALALLLCACEPRAGEQVEPEPARQRVATPNVQTESPPPPPAPAADPAPTPEPEHARATVILIPLRSFPDDLLDAVERGLQAELDVEVVRHELVELPDEAYYPPRKRYRAEKLLDFLEPFADEAGGKVKILGVTEVDISTSSDPYPDWGVFGLGQSPGRVAVISSKRLTRRPKNREHVRFRVATTAVHEIGHTFGLPHCDEHEAHCVMLDAEGGIENTDTSSGKLGPRCSAQLDALTVFGP